MIRRCVALLALVVLTSSSSLLLYPIHPVAGAANAANWQAGRIIDDAVFTDAGAMSAAQIQTFLNQKVGTGGYDSVPGQCDTNGARSAQPFSSSTRAAYAASLGRPTTFTCLNNYYEVPKLSPGPEVPASNYGGAPIPPGAKSAAQLIWDAAQAYSISPKVLLVTIQKESAGPLTTDDWPFQNQYMYTMGAHCPDSGPGGSANCDSNYAGFSLQISESAALLRWYLDNMSQPWWTYKKLGNNNILYKPDVSCGSSNINITSRGTAALYTYTPYQPNQAALNNLYGLGDACSAYGNRNFWRIFSDWFGSTQTTIPYAWTFSSSVAYADPARTAAYSPSPALAINPGSKAYITLKIRNNGYETWPQSVVYLGTSGPRDRLSGFSDTSWTSSGRIPLQETSVDPGEVGTFSFNLAAPVTAGSYTECFNVVAEHITWMTGQNLCYNIDVVTSQDSNTQDISLLSGQSINTGSYLMSSNAHSILVLQTDGNLVLYSDSKVQWHAQTNSPGISRLIMQTDGNLVLYDPSGRPLWASGTPGNPNAKAILQTDGNLVVYSSTNAPLWASATSHVPSYSNTVLHSLSGGLLYPQQSLQMADRSHTLLMQRDGNLVLYSNGHPIWASYTQGHPGAQAVMQSDGNLVIYGSDGRALWASYTLINPGSNLVLQDDGNLVIYNAAGKATWHTQTHGL